MVTPRLSHALRGGLIYGIGDCIAMLITGSFLWYRLLGITTLGASLYAFEITAYFNMIDSYSQSVTASKRKVLRMFMAMVYFNPLWIARHLLFLHIFSFQFNAVSTSLLTTGMKSFLYNIPVSIAANYFIQNKVPLSFRFYASAVFSGLMAVYYALSAVLFR